LRACSIVACSFFAAAGPSQRADEETHHGASLHDCDAPAYDESSYQKLREVFPDQSEPISIRLMFERELRDGATPEAMIDAARTYNQLVDGEPPDRAPLETNAAGVVGRWRIEARAVLKRRAAATMAKVATGERSAAARKLRADLLEYVASAEYARACSGGVPAAKDANLFGMLLASNGRIPSVETLRKRRAA